jgi:lysozyme
VRGAYHFFYPVPLGSDHLQKQVDAFLAQMGSLAANDLPPMVDVEVPVAGQEKWLVRAMTPQEIAASLTYWLSQVAQGCGRQPVIYTFPAYWKTRLGDSSSFHAFHLWIANWGSETSPGSKEFRPLGHAPTIPGRWPAFSIWQYAVLKGLGGINGLVDRDLIILPTGTSITDFLNGTPPDSSPS